MTSESQRWAERQHNPADGQASHSLCGPDCRYRGLYEASQTSLEDMAKRHAGSLQEHDDLRSGLVSLAKRLFPGEVRELERKGGLRLQDADDQALVMYLEGFVSTAVMRGKTGRASMETLRAVLSQQGYEIPKEHDLPSWAAAISAQGAPSTGGFPATESLTTRGMDDLDQALVDLLAADGVRLTESSENKSVEPGSGTSEIQKDQPDTITPEEFSTIANADHTSAEPQQDVAHSTEPDIEKLDSELVEDDLDAELDTDIEAELEELDAMFTDELEEHDLPDFPETSEDILEKNVTADDSEFSAFNTVNEESPTSAPLEIEPEEYPVTTENTTLGTSEVTTQGTQEPNLDLADMFGDLDQDAEKSDIVPVTPTMPAQRVARKGSVASDDENNASSDSVIMPPAQRAQHDATSDSTLKDSSDNAVSTEETRETDADLASMFSDFSDPKDPLPTVERDTSRSSDASEDLADMFSTETLPADAEPTPGAAATVEEDLDIVPVNSADLQDLFGDAAGSDTDKVEDSEQFAATQNDTVQINEPKPAFITPEEAGKIGVKPELIAESAVARKPDSVTKKKPSKRKSRKTKAQRPERIAFDVPAAGDGVSGAVALDPEISSMLTAAVEVAQPMFALDLKELVKDPAMVELWETEMRTINNPPVRFLSARRGHRNLGSLALPYRYRKNPPTDFARTWWAEMLELHRGVVLFELAVVMRELGEYIVGYEVQDEIVKLRANLPNGLTGIVLVTGDDLEEGQSTREAIANAVGDLSRERLAAIMVLVVRKSRENTVIELLTSEGNSRGWEPSMPVAVAISWAYAKDRGTTAKLALGGIG